MLLLMKNKAESMFNRPSPASSSLHKTTANLPPKANPSSFDFVKEYESNRTSQPDHESSSLDRGDKSLDYNSTLFRYFKE
jgi:hypothetical protein